MNKVVFTFSILVSAGFGYFIGINSEKSVDPVAVEAIYEKNLHIISVANNFQQMSSENNFHSIASSSQSSIQAASIDRNTQQQVDAVKAEYEFQQRSEAFTQWLTNNQKEKAWFDLGVEMRGRFDAEETDYNWALAEESHIQSLFSQAPALAGVALKSTRCKSTQCQITVSVVNSEHANETAMAISQVLGSERAAQVIIDNNQIRQGETILYVARNEKGFEFN
ncbi:hypothetical protein [Cellvibrio sp. pealriver]|uniref:hypothetical protein n=1 Tax=Cellvibrio sp. pealriver TaxID=1622269 RepID=UPI00066FC8E1|nr:hypothetical protein [Cellvibrio sp. pealriver]